MIVILMSKIDYLIGTAKFQNQSSLPEELRANTSFIMSTKEAKEKVMRSLRKLKGTEDDIGKISITDDFAAKNLKNPITNSL